MTEARAPIAVVALNLGGPDSPAAVRPFLRNLFRDPDVIQLGPMRFLQPLLARWIAARRAPESRAAYAQIGGRSPILDETRAQIDAVAGALRARGFDARPFVAMSCWHPFPTEAVRAIREQGIARAVALPLYPHESRTTTGSALASFGAAVATTQGALDWTAVRHYPVAPGYVDALCDTIRDAIATLPPSRQADAPVLFSAHGLPEAYIRRGDPYLDEVRTTVAAVTTRLELGTRALLAFQSRVGPQRWLRPYTEQVLDRLAAAGKTAVVVCPVAFTGEHIETLQELDIVYRERAARRGLVHFARARTVGTHPRFVAALADSCEQAARARGWE